MFEYEFVMLLLAVFAPILCWGELMRIRKILERMAGDGKGASSQSQGHTQGGAYSSAAKGWNR